MPANPGLPPIESCCAVCVRKCGSHPGFNLTQFNAMGMRTDGSKSRLSRRHARGQQKRPLCASGLCHPTKSISTLRRLGSADFCPAGFGRSRDPSPGFRAHLAPASFHRLGDRGLGTVLGTVLEFGPPRFLGRRDFGSGRGAHFVPANFCRRGNACGAATGEEAGKLGLQRRDLFLKISRVTEL